MTPQRTFMLFSDRRGRLYRNGIFEIRTIPENSGYPVTLCYSASVKKKKISSHLKSPLYVVFDTIIRTRFI